MKIALILAAAVGVALSASCASKPNATVAPHAPVVSSAFK